MPTYTMSCIQFPGIIDNATTCSQMEPYSGEVCREELVSLQLCLFDATASSSALNIPTSISQDSSEEMAEILVNGLSFLNPSEKCLGAILPFLCLALFPLCDPDNNLRTISRADCLSLRDEICVDTLRMAELFVQARVLPTCEDLPDISNECINSKLLCMGNFVYDYSVVVCIHRLNCGQAPL